MTLTKLAELIELAVRSEPTIHGAPPSSLTEMAADHYQPYYYLMYLLAKEQGGLQAKINIVELGVSRGFGITSFACGNPNANIIGLDLNVEPEHCPDNVQFHLMSALPVPDFISDVAILHIDTEHSYSNARNEFMQYRCKLLPGAVVMFDDLHAMDDGVMRAFYELPYPKIQDDRLHPGNGYGVLIYE